MEKCYVVIHPYDTEMTVINYNEHQIEVYFNDVFIEILDGHSEKKYLFNQ